MNNRLQVGGLALIVGCSEIPIHVGRVVTLDRLIEDAKFTDGSILTVWQVSADDLVDRVGNKTDYIYVEPHHLMPLGDKQTQDELAEEREVENA